MDARESREESLGGSLRPQLVEDVGTSSSAEIVAQASFLEHSRRLRADVRDGPGVRERRSDQRSDVAA